MRSDVAPSDIRDTLLRLIEAHPGLHGSELARRAGVSTKLAEYHLRTLEGAQQVTSTLGAHTRHYFRRRHQSPVVSDSVGVDAKRIWPHLRHTVRLHLAAALLNHPGLRNHELSSEVGLSRPATSYHLARMQRAGVVTQEPNGGYRLASPQTVADLLQRHRPPPDQVARLKGLLDGLGQ